MATPIHEYFPLEIFSLILRDACQPTGAHNDRQTNSHQACGSTLRVAIKFASVCRDWRRVVTSLPVFWSNIRITNFLHPSPREAMACAHEVLRRSDGRFRRVCLDFSSLKDVTSAAQIINMTLRHLLATAIATPLPSWDELCITAAKHEHIDAASDYFLLAPSAFRAKLGSIATLRLVLSQYPPVPAQPTLSKTQKRLQSYPPRNDSLPRFNTLHFKSLVDIHLTNIRILVFPAVLRRPSRLLQVYLENWTNLIDDTLLMYASAKPGEGHDNLQMIPLHIITNSGANMINCSLSFTHALTVAFPDTSSDHSPTSTSIVTASTSSSFGASSATGSTVSSNILTHLFLRNRIRHLLYVELSNITPQIWLTLLALLKPVSPNLLTSDPFLTPLSALSWKHLVVRFAPLNANYLPPGAKHSRQSAYHYLEKENAEHYTRSRRASTSEMTREAYLGVELEFDFDFGRELHNITSIEDLEALMKKCLVILSKDMLPRLRTFDCHDPEGRHWRILANLEND